MKKTLMILSMLIVLVLGISCSSPAGKAKHVAEEMNKQCPMDMAGVGSLESVTYDEPTNAIVMELNFSINGMEEALQAPEVKQQMKDAFIAGFVQTEDAKNIILDGTQFKINLNDATGKNIMSVAITEDDVK